ncbi:putative Zinc finger, C2H2 type-containing protein [Homarus americanus]|uniref:Putative Zinc finger, C2H2 type-containing protein n=1 Tax=Homarus americanus TaxID=6706 RepID=A0A8J5MTR5_HOMAM|nr:putative Zinc finger, C2H2 type-containing protein [Homarus americanus]
MRLEGLVGGGGPVASGSALTNMNMGVNMGGSVGGGEEVGVVACPVCSKRVQLSYLSLHLKRTHDSLEVRCPLCAKMFKNKHSLSVHQARYHPRNIHNTPNISVAPSSSTPVSPSGHHHHQRPPTPTYIQPSPNQQLPTTPTTPIGPSHVYPQAPPQTSGLWYHTHLEETTPTAQTTPPAPPRLDLLRAFEYGATATELGIPGSMGSTYLDAGGGLHGGGLGGGPGGGHVVPWRRPLGGSDGYVSCPQCQKPITSYNLNRHVRMVHSNMEHATCPVCSKEFKNKYSLATHMHRQHSDTSSSGHPRTTC